MCARLGVPSHMKPQVSFGVPEEGEFALPLDGRALAAILAALAAGLGCLGFAGAFLVTRLMS